ncbi:SMC-Scp complex subunit ScpB [Patescibacteria group bacterium]
MDTSNTSCQIEALLFLSGKPMDTGSLCKILDKDKKAITKALDELENTLAHRGLVLLRKDNDVALGTSKKCSKCCDSFLKEEVNRSLGRAGLETLAIILYKEAGNSGGVSRNDIDSIRGVNSTFTIRNLLVRGLIERKQDIQNKRSYLYTPALKLFEYLGISSKKELPDYEDFKEKIEDVIKHYQNN